MSDLLSAMVQRSKAYADPIAAAYASGNRPFTVRITRPGAPSTFDRDTHEYVDEPDQVIYIGPARIYTISGGSRVEIGEETLAFSNARVSIDPLSVDNSPNPEVPPRVEDMIEVLDTPQAVQTHVKGRSFTVDDVEVGGHFGIGYLMAATGVEPSRRS